MKAFITPTYDHADQADGGIRRVSDALRRYLPEYGVEVVNEPAQADVINSHATEMIEGCEHIPVVQSSHGMMWYEYFNHEWDGVNQRLIDTMKRADVVTAPSQWVARAIMRGLAHKVKPIYHGVDAELFTVAETPANYVLWNKARSDAVSDPHDVMELAAAMPETRFISTIGNEAGNLRIMGVVPYEEMQRVVRQAGVYLATARETFGIGTLEAMASGVPIAGWAYGGQREIVIQGETGYLAPHGDYKALAECVRMCLEQRQRLGENARQDALNRWAWKDKVGQYVAAYEQAIAINQRRPLVSVIVTAYNLAKYLPDAIESVKAQTLHDWECLIIDDHSIDDTPQVAQAYCDDQTRYIKTPFNMGLPEARNYGMAQAQGKYVIPLDADDKLTPDALTLLAAKLEADKSTHIAYGHLDIMNEAGTETRPSGWAVTEYAWHEQLAHHNQLHYSALMRRSMFERTQGYRRRSWQAEDAEWWCYATSWGFNANRATADNTLSYRLRPNSKTSENKALGTQWSDGDWTAWTPYLRNGNAVPFSAQGKPTRGTWLVSHGETPVVSVIIPVGANHTLIVQDAIDSLLAQSYQFWECIVVNDSGKPLDLRGYGFVRYMETSASGGQGTSRARNLGAANARAPFLVFLDADDYLQPAYLETVLNAKKAHDKKESLVYTDWYQEHGNGQPTVWNAQDYHCNGILHGMIYNVSVLLPRILHEKVGGFDETMRIGWEDWDYFIKLALIGTDAIHVVKPLMTYRYQTGERREAAYAQKPELLALIDKRYAVYRDSKEMS
jgi:glycosyltransferase involved in cell wall biosynthesis